MLLNQHGRPFDLAETVDLSEARSLDEPGWLQLGGPSVKDTDPVQHRQMAEEAWKAYLYHPMASRQVDFITAFIAGKGFGVGADDQEAQPAIDAFIADPDNRWDDSVEEITRRYEIEGEVFVTLFANGRSGRVAMREIEPAEIEEIITDPDDVTKPLYYWRRFERKTWAGRGYATELVEQFIPALGATDAQLRKVSVPDDLVVMDRVMLHHKFGAVSTRKRGKSPLASHLAWMRRYSNMLRLREDNLRARSSWVWDVAVDGDAKAVDAVKGKHKKPPRSGSINIHAKQEAWTPQAPDVGGQDASEDLRAVKMMTVAGSGLPEHALTGDASNGNFASSKVQDMPMIKLIESRQKKWSGFWARVFAYVLAAALKAGTIPGRVTDEIKGEDGAKTSKVRPIRETVTATYPEIYTLSAEDRLKAAQAARFWHEMGVSLRTLMGESDYDYDDEIEQRMEEEVDERRRTISAVQADAARDLGGAAARLAAPDEAPAGPPSG